MTYSQNSDAFDAIDNMHLNELQGRVRGLAHSFDGSFLIKARTLRHRFSR